MTIDNNTSAMVELLILVLFLATIMAALFKYGRQIETAPVAPAQEAEATKEKKDLFQQTPAKQRDLAMSSALDQWERERQDDLNDYCSSKMGLASTYSPPWLSPTHDPFHM